MERTSSAAIWGIGLVSILVAGGVWIVFGPDTGGDPSVSLLAAAILLSGFCGIFGHKDDFRVSNDVVTIILLAGLGLGGVLGVEPVNRLCIVGILGYAGFFLARHMAASLQKTVALVHLGVAMILGIVSVFVAEDEFIVGGLFLLMTFLPLVPFHLPFLGIVRSSSEASAGVWVVAWLAVGLSHLNALDEVLHAEGILVLPILALVSAIYTSLKAMGYLFPRESIAYATLTLFALLWGLLNVFPSKTLWGIPYGIAVALLMSAVLHSFAFLHQRYGTHSLTSLQGLGSGLPRFRGTFTFLISFIMLLPFLPVVAAFTVMPPDGSEDQSIFPVLLLVSTVWLSVSWIFTTMLHQTAFGNPRSDVPGRDLSVYEMWTLLLLMGGAGFCGIPV